MSVSVKRKGVFFAYQLCKNYNFKSSMNYFARFLRFKALKKLPIKSILLFPILFFGKKEEKSILTESATIKPQYKKADDLFENNKFQESYDLLKTFENQSDPETLWRSGRALYRIATNNSSKNHPEMIRQGFKLLSQALEKDDKNFAVHVWYAILLDAKSNLDGIKERCIQLQNVKKHIQLAVDLNPRDPTSYYLLGEFTYGFAHLSWYQRKLVSTIFAAPPNGTYEEALEHFLKAESLGDDIYHKNKLMIGKCYYNLKNFVEAKKYLAKCASITPLNEADRKAKEESKILLGKISKEKLSRPN